MKKIFLPTLLVGIFAALLCIGCGSEKNSTAYTGVKKIYFISMDGKSTFQNDIDKGCRQAVEKLGNIEYKLFSPKAREIPEQAKCIDMAVAEKPDAILISAISVTEVNENLKKAEQEGIKIFYVDSAAAYEGVMTLTTDNEAAGKIAGKTMLKALKEAGIESGTIEVAMNEFSTQNTALRDKGFRSVFEGTPYNITSTFYMNGDFQAMKNEIAAHPDYVGFFCANQKSTVAVGEQMKEFQSSQIVVGFDAAEETLAMIREGFVYATIKQNAEKMGYDGVEYAVKTLEGTFNETNVVKDTGVNVITKENVDQQDK